MSLEFLSRILPTSEDSIAYRLMRQSALGRGTGIRKHLPDCIDVRVNAVAFAFFASLGVLFTGTRLLFCACMIVPLFTTRLPIFKDFFYNIATLVKAALAILHGQSSGLLPPSSYYELSNAEYRPMLDKSLLVALPRGPYEKRVLTDAINRIGKKDCLELWWQHKRFDFILDVQVKDLFNDNDFLEMYLKYDCVNNLSYAYGDDNQWVQNFKRKFSPNNPNELMISILSNKSIPESIKTSVGKLCCIQTGIKDETRATVSVIEAMFQELSTLGQITPQTSIAINNKLNGIVSILNHLSSSPSETFS